MPNALCYNAFVIMQLPVDRLIRQLYGMQPGGALYSDCSNNATFERSEKPKRFGKDEK